MNNPEVAMPQRNSTPLDRRRFLQLGAATAATLAGATSLPSVLERLGNMMPPAEKKVTAAVPEKPVLPNATPLPEALRKPSYALSPEMNKALQLDRLNPELRSQVHAEIQRKTETYAEHDNRDLNSGVKTVLRLDHRVTDIAENLEKLGIAVPDIVRHQLLNIIFIESAGNVDAFNEKETAIGLGQIRPAAHQDIMTYLKPYLAKLPELADNLDNSLRIQLQMAAKNGQLDLRSASANIAASMVYLNNMYSHYNNNIIAATAAYNRGPGEIDNLLKTSPTPSLADIMKNGQAYDYVTSTLGADEVLSPQRVPTTSRNVQR